VESHKNVVAAIAAVAILLSLFSIIRGCACSPSTQSVPTVPEADRNWILAATGGWFACPECGEKVTLTAEQQRLGKPPDMTCPHCGKKVDFAKLGRAPVPGRDGAAPAAPPKMEDLYFPGTSAPK